MEYNAAIPVSKIINTNHTMPCHQPNPIETSPRIRRWGAQLEKHSAYLTVKSLLFTTVLFIFSGYALTSWLLAHPEAKARLAVPVIHMGIAALIFMSLYFVGVDYLFRNRPQEVRLVQRFIWYLAILFIVMATGFCSLLMTR